MNHPRKALLGITLPLIVLSLSCSTEIKEPSLDHDAVATRGIMTVGALETRATAVFATAVARAVQETVEARLASLASLTRTPQPFSSATAEAVPATPAAPTPQVTGGADSPEGAVLAACRAIAAEDANAYLDVVDPRLRANPANYFFFSQVLNAATSLVGLGGLGKEATRVSFSSLEAKVISAPGALAKVQVSGLVRYTAFAMEQPFEEIVLARQLGEKWFVSAPTSGEQGLAVEATRQAIEQEEEIEKLRQELLIEFVLQKGELVAFPYDGLLAHTLRPGGEPRWMEVPELGLAEGQTRVSPDGKRIALSSCRPGRRYGLWIKDIDGSNEQLVRPRYGWECYHPNWAPDSQRLAVAALGYVETVDVQTGIGDIVWKGEVDDVTFMPDGKRLLLGLRRGVLMVYDPDSGYEEELAILPDSPRNIVWSQDWKQFSFDAQGLWIANADGSNLRQIAPDIPHVDYNPVWSPDGTLLFTSGQVLLTDGTPLPGVVGAKAIWWIEGDTRAVRTRIALVEEGKKERTIKIGFAEQVQALRFTLHEFEVTQRCTRIHLSVENSGTLGRVFIRLGETAKLYVLDPGHVALGPGACHSGVRWRGCGVELGLKIAADPLSVLPAGKSWDGWLETLVPAPPTAVGAIFYVEFEFEKPYDERSTTEAIWLTSHLEEEDWYLPLR